MDKEDINKDACEEQYSRSSTPHY